MKKNEIFRILFVCSCWFLVSSANNIVGKTILTDFPYPLTLSMVQLASVTFYSGPLFTILGIRKWFDVGWSYYIRLIIPLAFGKFLANLFALVSIWKVPLSYAHTIKASMPLFTVAVSRIILGEKQTWGIYFSLIPIVGGVAIATVSELSFDILGLVSALISTNVLVVTSVVSKKVLKETGVHHLRLLHVTGRLAMFMFLPVWFFFDFFKILSHPIIAAENATFDIFFLLLIDGILHWLQNILAFTMIKLVSPLSYAVANASKKISVIVISLLVMRNPVSLLNVTGMTMAIISVFIYNKLKYEQNKRKNELPMTVKSTQDQPRNPLWNNGLQMTPAAYAFSKTNDQFFHENYIARNQ